jgi:hypothetical protein
VRLPRDRKTGACLHTAGNVYGEMLRQVCRDYSSLPDPRSLTDAEIVYFYNGLRPELQAATKTIPKG